MVAHSVGILFGRVVLFKVLRFESGGDGAFRNAPHPSSNFLRGIVQRIGRQAFRFGLPGRPVVDIAGDIFCRV